MRATPCFQSGANSIQMRRRRMKLEHRSWMRPDCVGDERTDIGQRPVLHEDLLSELPGGGLGLRIKVDVQMEPGGVRCCLDDHGRAVWSRIPKSST